MGPHATERRWLRGRTAARLRAARLLGGAAVVFAGLVTVMAGADQQVQTPLRIATDLITVDVSVLDGDRRPIRGLTAGDFTVLEDGEPRPIVAFSVVDVPTRDDQGGDASRATWTADVVANDLPAEGRLVVILFDRSIAAGAPVAAARQIAAAAVDRLGPGDVAAVVRTGGFAGNGRVQGFTADRRLLMTAIDSTFTGETPFGLNPSPIPGLDASTPGCPCGVCAFDTLGNVVDAMSEAPRRRKVLLFIGSAITVPTAVASDRCYSPTQDARARLDRQLEMANVTVHAIDPSGVIATAPRAQFTVPQGVSSTRATSPQGAYAQADASRLDSLRVLPEQTGGRLVANTNTPGEHLPAIFEETRSYYLLGFEPSAAPDARFRRIDVRVHQRGANVRARRGYVFDRPAPAAAGADDTDVMSDLIAALRAPQPAQGVPLVMSVAPFPGATLTTTPVAVLVGASTRQQDGPQRFAMAAGAFDISGEAVAVHMQTIEVSGARPDGGIDGLNARLDLPPGRYEVRAAVRDERTRALGSVFAFLDVPEPGPDVMALSGLLFRRDAPPSPLPAGALDGLMPFLPTVARRFAPADRVTVFARVSARTGAGPVSVRAVVIDDAGTRRFERTTTIEAAQLTSGSATYAVALPLAELPRGEYLVQVEATAGPHRARREAVFGLQ